MLETATSDPRLAYNYATTEDGDADREQGRKVQERTVRVMRSRYFWDSWSSRASSSDFSLEGC